MLLNPAAILIGVLFLFLLLSFCHLLAFEFVSWPGVIGFFLKITIAYSTFHYYHDREESFEMAYVKVISALSLLSLPFFFINFFGHFGLNVNESGTIKSLFFYTSIVNYEETIRNSGMFWEPGAFAGYLTLGILFIFTLNADYNLYSFRKYFILIFIGIISTFSTTGYIVFTLILSIYILINFRYARYFLIPVYTLSFIHLFTNLPFLQEKLVWQIQEAIEMDVIDVSNTRFGALNMDLQYMSSSPWFGNGLHFSTRYRFHSWITEDIGHGNGMSNFIAFWGVPLFLLWIFMVYRFFRQKFENWKLALFSAFVMLLMLQGEQFLNYPMFLGFFILSPFSLQKLNVESSLDC